jgi:hypothetical protein
VGAVPPLPHPPAVAGIPVVSETISLGVPQRNPPPPLPLPARAYPTRHALRPPPPPAAPPPSPLADRQWAARLATATARQARLDRLPLSAMGRGLATSTYTFSTFLFHAEFDGLPDAASAFAASAAANMSRPVPPALLTGSPSVGGFGLLPLREHLSARSAAMAGRLLRHLALPRPPAASPTPPWVSLATVLLCHACPALHPAQTLLSATVSTPDDVAAGTLGAVSARGVAQPHCLPPGVLTRMAVALCALGPPCHSSSVPAVVAALTTRPPDPSVPPAALAGLAWPPPPGALSDPIHPVAGTASVRALTCLLTAPVTAARAARHAAFVSCALHSSPRADASASLRAFRSSLGAAWRLRCDNRLKEPLWRLAVDAVPGSLIRPWTCPCGARASAAAPPRQHSFWDCPVAVAVRAQLALALHEAPSQPHVWLLQPPRASLRPGVWTLVCLAALSAMEYGRRRLWADRESSLDVVGRAAVLRFWCDLQAFVSSCPSPPSAWGPLGADHPFLCERDGALFVSVPSPV